MQKYERDLLFGIFLIIIGIFMPLHGITEYHRIYGGGGRLEARIIDTIIGHDLIVGWVILILALVLFVLVLVFIKETPTLDDRVIIAEYFIISLIIALFIIGGITPVFTRNKVVPHIGLLSLFLGNVMLLKGVKQLRKQS